jgi:signal transduction histidine kinase
VIDAGALDGVAVLSGPDSMLWRCLSGGEAWQTPLRGTDIVVAGEPKPVNLRICRLEGGGALISLFDAAPLRDVLEAHDALISITSHELKTPLTEMIGDIHHQAERLEQLIREILDASQIDSGRTQLVLHDVDLKELFAEVADELETQLQGRKLVTKLPSRLPRVRADYAKLRQVGVNLLTNAIKYSPEGAPVSLKASVQSELVRVEVKDQGIGIRPEDLGRLFKKFQRIQDPATRRTSGTGLGLYIVKGLVELQGGTVEAFSTYGKGSVFAFTIPVANGAKNG